MSAATKADLAGNVLLSVLTEDDRQRLLPHMMTLELPAEAILLHSGQDVTDTWFPCTSAMAGFCIRGANGHSVDVAFVGREGAIGGIVSHGHVPAYATAVVRVPGTFLRIKTSALEQAKIESIHLRHWFSRYSDCLLAQVFQTAACNATHTIRQRIAKLILAGMERTGSTEIPMTQEQLADMLGVGRTFVSRILGTLRKEGVVESRRGTLSIRNLHALRGESCHCTQAIEDHFDAVLHGIYPKP
jgi:CRP-like cAMP-binding protein